MPHPQFRAAAEITPTVRLPTTARLRAFTSGGSDPIVQPHHWRSRFRRRRPFTATDLEIGDDAALAAIAMELPPKGRDNRQDNRDDLGAASSGAGPGMASHDRTKGGELVVPLRPHRTPSRECGASPPEDQADG